MGNDGVITLETLNTPEISLIMKELGAHARINLSEREFREIIAKKDVFKIMLNYAPFGIIAITPKPLAEITIWLSDRESKEKWIEAIKKTILKAFEKPEVFKIKWSVAESCKNMIEIAQSCSFEKESEQPNEGPNRETMITFGLSRNGNSPESSLHASPNAEQEKTILSLETKLKNAEELNQSLQKSLLEADKKRRIAENNFLLLKEKRERNKTNKSSVTNENQTSQIGELTIQRDEALKDKGKFKEWLENKKQELKEKNRQLEEAQKTIADRDATIKRLDGEIIEFSKLLGEKTQRVNELTKTTAEPSELAPETDDPYKEIADLLLIASPDKQMEKIRELIEKRINKAGINRNHKGISSLTAAAGTIINSDQQQITVKDLAERMECTTATIHNLIKDLQVLEIVYIVDRGHKHSIIKLKTSGAEVAEKNLAKKKKSLADVKLVPRDLQILQTIIESGQSGIFQQEIIKKTGSNQSDISRAVRVLAAKGLVKNQQEGIRSKAIAQMDQIRLQLPDMIKPMEQSEPEKDPSKDESVKDQPPETKKPEEKIAEIVIVQKPSKLPETKPEPDETIKTELMLLSDSLTNKEPGLLNSLPDNKKQQVEDYLNECLEKEEKISLSVVCSKAGVKKNQAKPFISAIVKSMNKKTDNPNDRIKAIKISPNEDDFENSTIELLSKTEFLSELEKDKPPQEKPEEKIVTTSEPIEHLRDESNVNGTDIAGKPKKTLAQLKNTSGLGDIHKKMLDELEKTGGTSTKRQLKQKFRLHDTTFSPYLDLMVELKVIRTEDNIILLNL